jgi:hypothetical protein
MLWSVLCSVCFRAFVERKINIDVYLVKCLCRRSLYKVAPSIDETRIIGGARGAAVG